MTIVVRRLSISIVAVNFLVSVAAALSCMEGWGRIAVISGFAIIDLALVICIIRQSYPDAFIPVFTASGLSALALFNTPSGLLFVFLPVLCYMTGIVRPDEAKPYARFSKLIAAAYFGLLWSARTFVKTDMLGTSIIAELAGTAGAFIVTALIVHVEGHRREMLKFEARQFRESAEKDALTGLYNRKNLERCITEQARGIETFSLIMMDIDNFKKVNDTYGHVEGDAVLKDLALVIQCHIRSVDCAFRYGGEEFCIVCPKTDAKNAGMLAERIREAFSSKKYEYPAFDDPELKERRYTVSLGVTDTRMGSYRNPKELIEHCDSALYEAKHTGKNKVVYYKETEAETPKIERT